MEHCGETVLEVTGSSYQNVYWKEYGFQVTVPEGAVSKDATVHLAVKAILSGQFKLPDDAFLVSDIFWVCASDKFFKAVSVHIQHCAIINSEEEASNYKFILGRCSQKSRPYTFSVKEGVIAPHSQLATISVKQFSIFAVIFRGRGNPQLTYASHYYFRQVQPTRREFMFLVTVNLKSQRKVK